MHAKHAYFAQLAAPRYRALGIVVVVHLALGWWLLRGAAPQEHQIRRPPLAPELIQDVMVASPAPSLQPSPKSSTQPQPQPQPQPSARPPEAVSHLPVTKSPAHGAPPPVAAHQPAAPQLRDVQPDATVSAPTVPATPTPSPMASPLMPSAQQAPGVPSLPAASHPVASSVAMPSATPVSGMAKSGPVTPTQPRASVPTGSAAGAAAPIADIALVCATQVAPVMPRLAKRGGITGVVQVQAVIVDGAVRDVRILSGPPVFHNAVREAMRQYRCQSGPSEVLATQEFVFKFEQ